MVLKEIKNKQTVEFWINVGRTAVPLILAAAMFFTPAGSALAIAVATGSAVTDISASIWDFHDARISNELAYSSAIGNEFSSTSMASADFQYGMAIFNMVLSAVSISEIKNATKAYKSFNGLSKEARDLIGKVSPSTGKRLLKELEEGELTKLLTVSESQFEKMSKLSTKQLKEVLNSASMNDILKAVDEIPVDKFDDVVVDEIISNLREPKSSANKKQVEAVKNITNPNEQLEKGNHNFTMKGNYGEIKTDIDLEKDGLYERVSNFRVESLDAKGHHGIDGIYRNANPPPDFIIVDSKYLGTEKAVDEAFAPRMSKIENGTQMDAKWIRKNLEDSIDDRDLLFEIQNALDNNRVDSVAAKVDNTGKVTYYKLDYDGKIIRDNVSNKPIIYNVNKE